MHLSILSLICLTVLAAGEDLPLGHPAFVANTDWKHCSSTGNVS
jgi:hypothetical protein